MEFALEKENDQLLQTAGILLSKPNACIKFVLESVKHDPV